MLKSILVTTANGKPQTASSRLPFAVNAMLKVSNSSLSAPRRKTGSFPVVTWKENVFLAETIEWIAVLNILNKKQKRHTHFFGPRDSKLSMAFANTPDLSKSSVFSGEFIYNQYTHQSSHLFWDCRSSRVDVLSKSPCFWSSAVAKWCLTSSNLVAWGRW